MRLGIVGILFLFGIIFVSMISIGEAWAANATSFREVVRDPGTAFFTAEGTGVVFFLFIMGIAIYAIFVWYFYRFISKRDMLPKLFYVIENQDDVSIIKKILYSSVYVISFPIIIFAWFTILAFFIYIIAEGMPVYLTVFVSMILIAAVRILTYYKEDAAKEIAKMVPYAILSFLLTSAAVYNNPNFFSEKELTALPHLFIENYDVILVAVGFIAMLEYSFRTAFIIKRRFRPVSEKKLEEEIQSEVEEITKAHFKKMEDKEKWLEKKLEEKNLEFKKIVEQQKELEKKLKELQKKPDDSK